MTGSTTKLPLIVAIVIAVLMAASLAWQGWQFNEEEQQRMQGPAATDSQSADAATLSRNDRALAMVNLFGDPAAGDQPEPSQTENLPETNLRLVLRGVMAGDENSRASALIEDSNNRTEAYRIEDELPGNATLKSVYANRVIIQRSGVLENLYFPEAKKGSNIRVTSTAPSQQSSQPEPAAPAQQPEQSSQTRSSARQEEIRNRLEQLRERLRNNSS